MDYADSNFVDIRPQRVEVENWEHDGFCTAFPDAKIDEATRCMWGDYTFPESWTLKKLWALAIIETPWFKEVAKEKATKERTFNDLKRLLAEALNAQTRVIGEARHPNLVSWHDCNFDEEAGKGGSPDQAEVKKGIWMFKNGYRILK